MIRTECLDHSVTYSLTNVWGGSLREFTNLNQLDMTVRRLTNFYNFVIWPPLLFPLGMMKIDLAKLPSDAVTGASIVPSVLASSEYQVIQSVGICCPNHDTPVRGKGRNQNAVGKTDIFSVSTDNEGVNGDHVD